MGIDSSSKVDFSGGGLGSRIGGWLDDSKANHDDVMHDVTMHTSTSLLEQFNMKYPSLFRPTRCFCLCQVPFQSQLLLLNCQAFA